ATRPSPISASGGVTRRAPGHVPPGTRRPAGRRGRSAVARNRGESPRFGPPPYPATRRGSAAAALRGGCWLTDGDLVLQAIVELLADTLHPPQVLRLPERLFVPTLDDRLRLRRPDTGKTSELVRAGGIQVHTSPVRRRDAGGDGAAPGPRDHEPAEEPDHHCPADPLHLHLLWAPPAAPLDERQGQGACQAAGQKMRHPQCEASARAKLSVTWRRAQASLREARVLSRASFRAGWHCTGCSSAWKSTAFGTQEPLVQIQSPRPSFSARRTR